MDWKQSRCVASAATSWSKEKSAEQPHAAACQGGTQNFCKTTPCSRLEEPYKNFAKQPHAVPRRDGAREARNNPAQQVLQSRHKIFAKQPQGLWSEASRITTHLLACRVARYMTGHMGACES